MNSNIRNNNAQKILLCECTEFKIAEKNNLNNKWQ